MQIEQAVLLGILQGIIEWLPIAARPDHGDMLALYGITPAAALSCSIFLHLGTMTAVLVKFRQSSSGCSKPTQTLRTIIIATLCTGITGLPLYLLMRIPSGSTQVTLIGLLLVGTGLILRAGRSGIRTSRMPPGTWSSSASSRILHPPGDVKVRAHHQRAPSKRAQDVA